MNQLLCLFALAAVIGLSAGRPEGGFNPLSKCVRFADENKEAQNCTCSVGYKGDGDLCCVPNSAALCILRDDPHLKSTRDRKSVIDFPCTYSVAKISSVVGDLECQLEIFTAGNFINYAQYNDRLGLRFSIGGEEKILKLISNGFYDPLAKTYTEMSVGRAQQTVRVASSEFRMGYDYVLKRWNVAGCGGELFFRAPANASVLQERTPGLCVFGPRNQIVGAPGNGNICNLNDNFLPNPYKKIWQRLLAIQLDAHSQIPAQLRVDPEPIEDVCTDLSSYFGQCTKARKVQAIELCSPLIHAQMVRHCLSENNSDIVAAFRDCIVGFCGREKSGCDRLKANIGVKNCHTVATECDGW